MSQAGGNFSFNVESKPLFEKFIKRIDYKQIPILKNEPFHNSLIPIILILLLFLSKEDVEYILGINKIISLEHYIESLTQYEKIFVIDFENLTGAVANMATGGNGENKLTNEHRRLILTQIYENIKIRGNKDLYILCLKDITNSQFNQPVYQFMKELTRGDGNKYTKHIITVSLSQFKNDGNIYSAGSGDDFIFWLIALSLFRHMNDKNKQQLILITNDMQKLYDHGKDGDKNLYSSLLAPNIKHEFSTFTVNGFLSFQGITHILNNILNDNDNNLFLEPNNYANDYIGVDRHRYCMNNINYYNYNKFDNFVDQVNSQNFNKINKNKCNNFFAVFNMYIKYIQNYKFPSCGAELPIVCSMDKTDMLLNLNFLDPDLFWKKYNVHDVSLNQKRIFLKTKLHELYNEKLKNAHEKFIAFNDIIANRNISREQMVYDQEKKFNKELEKFNKKIEQEEYFATMEIRHEMDKIFKDIEKEQKQYDKLYETEYTKWKKELDDAIKKLKTVQPNAIRNQKTMIKKIEQRKPEKRIADQTKLLELHKDLEDELEDFRENNLDKKKEFESEQQQIYLDELNKHDEQTKQILKEFNTNNPEI
jgi:hypothetical protein